MQCTCSATPTTPAGAAETKLKGTNRATLQPFFYKAILDPNLNGCLFSCIQFAGCFQCEVGAEVFKRSSRTWRYGRSRLAAPLQTDSGHRSTAPLLCHVPHVQKIAVTGGLYLASSFASSPIQRGTNFFLGLHQIH